MYVTMNVTAQNIFIWQLDWILKALPLCVRVGLGVMVINGALHTSQSSLTGASLLDVVKGST